MSVYKKSWRFMMWTWAVFFSFPIWWSVLTRYFGEAGATIGGAFWLCHGFIMLTIFRCPACSRSLFMRGIWCVPWPAKICSKCGIDLTVAEPV
jgi:hypothetical protein